jgi:hypothetical protein
MKTVWIYIAASKKLATPYLSRSLLMRLPLDAGSQGTTALVLLSNMRCQSKTRRPPHWCDAVNRGAPDRPEHDGRSLARHLPVL